MKPTESDVSSSNKQPEPAPALCQEQYWQEHIIGWAQSGLSQSAYCRREGLKLHRWHYWHKKLSRGLVSEPAKRSDFIPVHVRPQAMEDGLRITLPNGLSIEGVNEQTVRLLGAVLKQL